MNALYLAGVAAAVWLLLRAFTYGRWRAETHDLVSPWSDGDGAGFADYDNPPSPRTPPVPLPPLDDAPAEVIREVADRQTGYVRDGLDALQVFLTQQHRHDDGDGR